MKKRYTLMTAGGICEKRKWPQDEGPDISKRQPWKRELCG
jgi:hypothetical protein